VTLFNASSLALFIAAVIVGITTDYGPVALGAQVMFSLGVLVGMHEAFRRRRIERDRELAEVLRRGQAQIDAMAAEYERRFS